MFARVRHTKFTTINRFWDIVKSWPHLPLDIENFFNRNHSKTNMLNCYFEYFVMYNLSRWR